MTELRRNTGQSQTKTDSAKSPENMDSGGDSLLYLNSNNCTENSVFSPEDLTPYHRKQTFSLIKNCDNFIERVGINHVGFLTLTFPDNVLEHKEALKRWRSLRTHCIDKLFGIWMLVKERQKRGAIHYHFLIECPFDIRTGFNFDEVFPKKEKEFPYKGKRPKYTSACPELRMLWQALREAMPKYGFGRSELAPIRSNGEVMAKYVGKYISKNSTTRKASKYDELDKGARLIAYSQDWARSNTKFSWNSDGAKEWRRKVQIFANIMGCECTYELKKRLGRRWAHKYRDAILDIDNVVEAANENVPF